MVNPQPERGGTCRPGGCTMGLPAGPMDPGLRLPEGRCILMADLGGMADKAKDAAQDNPEKVDQAKDKIKDAVDGNKDEQK